MTMISLKRYIEKIRNEWLNMSILDKAISCALTVWYIATAGMLITARVMENQQVDLKEMYGPKHQLIGFSVNDRLYEFKTRELPEEAKALVADLQENCINVLVKPWMEEPDVNEIRNNKVTVKLFKVDKAFLEDIVYTKRYPDGVCDTREYGNSIIYIDEDVYANRDSFITVYIHEYIHAMSQGGNSYDFFDKEKDEWTYTIVKEGYTEYLTDVVIEKAGLRKKYNMQKEYGSAYDDAKYVAAELDSFRLENEDYPIMRAYLFADYENYMGETFGDTYEELNRLLEEDPYSEVIPKLLWRMESEFC